MGIENDLRQLTAIQAWAAEAVRLERESRDPENPIGIRDTVTDILSVIECLSDILSRHLTSGEG